MGELSVLILAATGVASLVFVTHRADTLSTLTAPLPAGSRRTRRPLVETSEGLRPRVDGARRQPQAWLVGGQRVRPENRSILLEVIVRILFHTIIIVSLYLLFAGHNLPGGGFAGRTRRRHGAGHALRRGRSLRARRRRADRRRAAPRRRA